MRADDEVGETTSGKIWRQLETMNFRISLFRYALEWLSTACSVQHTSVSGIYRWRVRVSNITMHHFP